MTVTHDIHKLISISHKNITRIKGKDYAPTAFEIEKEILKMISIMENKQTAVDYFKDELIKEGFFIPGGIYAQAKQMEKEQIERAYIKGGVFQFDKDKEAEQYYNETLKL